MTPSALFPRIAPESLDGRGAGDHDLPYVFGRVPRTLAPFPFSTREYARLLIVRSKVGAGLLGADDLGPAAYVGATPRA
jgi:hypothetical protein